MLIGDYRYKKAMPFGFVNQTLDYGCIGMYSGFISQAKVLTNFSFLSAIRQIIIRKNRPGIVTKPSCRRSDLECLNLPRTEVAR